MNQHLKIAVLDMYNNAPNEGMRCIKVLLGEFLSQEGIQGNYDIFNVRAEDELPSLKYDIFVSTGGPGNPMESGELWEERYFELIDAIFEHNRLNEKKKFLFLICHSFQMVAKHLEIGTVLKRKSTSFGIMPIHLTDEGTDEQFFEGLPEPFYAVDSRDYQLIQPNWEKIHELNAQILCLEKDRPHVPLERAIMAIRFSEEVFGTQFHPEADSEGMLRYFQREDKRLAVINEYGEAKYNEMVDRLDDPDKIMLTEKTIIPKFLEFAAERILETELV
jgi:homoserine O-succinyltransferase/O-acetyltransferase